MPNAKPQMDRTERAARDFLNRKVREGIIGRRDANQLLKTGLPFVTAMLAQWRREGTSPQWLTDKFLDIRAEAERAKAAARGPIAQRLHQGRVVAAEMYLAVWAGMQADLGEFRAQGDAARAADSAPRAVEVIPQLASRAALLLVAVRQCHDAGGRRPAGRGVAAVPVHRARFQAEEAFLLFRGELFVWVAVAVDANLDRPEVIALVRERTGVLVWPKRSTGAAPAPLAPLRRTVSTPDASAPGS